MADDACRFTIVTHHSVLHADTWLDDILNSTIAEIARSGRNYTQNLPLGVMASESRGVESLSVYQLQMQAHASPCQPVPDYASLCEPTAARECFGAHTFGTHIAPTDAFGY